MKLFLLRHGGADWPDWDGPDDERPLTNEGASEVKKAAAALCRLKIEPALIVTSPLPRAAQTARIAARELGLKVREDDALKPGFDVRKCRTLLTAHGEGDLMIVGHEPDFSGVVKALTGGMVKLSKAGLAVVEIPAATAEARLLWLIPPRVLIRLYG